jgi:hypothetical protein
MRVHVGMHAHNLIGLKCCGQLTVNDVDDWIPPILAPIVVTPDAWAVASPATPGLFAMVATVPDVELQWELSVKSCVVASLNVPVRANCCVPPIVMVGLIGVIAVDTSVPLPTTSVAVPVIPTSVALIVAVPARFPRAIPVPRMDASCGLVDFQETPGKLFTTLPSL